MDDEYIVLLTSGTMQETMHHAVFATSLHILRKNKVKISKKFVTGQYKAIKTFFYKIYKFLKNEKTQKKKNIILA